MGKKSSAPAAPDFSGIAAASQENAELSAAIALEQLDFAREQYAGNQENLDRVMATTLPIMEEQARTAAEDREYWEEQWKPVEAEYLDAVRRIGESDTPERLAQVNLDIMERNVQIADEYQQRYREQFQPLEQSLVDEANEFDQPWRQDQEAAERVADVDFQFEAQRDNALRELESYGVDPSQTRHQALDVDVRTAEAAAKASAAQQGRQSITDQARALRAEGINLGMQMDPRAAAAEQMASGAGLAAAGAEAIPIGYYGEQVNVGRGLPAQSSTQYAQSVGAGQSAMGSSTQALSGMQYMGSPTDWMQTSNQGYTGATNALSAGYSADLSQYEANSDASGALWGGIGTLAGAAIGGPFGGALGGALFSGAGPAVTGLAEGGAVPDLGMDPTDRADTIPARLSENEYVIPADVVKRKGTEFFDKMRTKVREEIQESAGGGDGALPVPGYAVGGSVVNPDALQQRLEQIRSPEYRAGLQERMQSMGIAPQVPFQPQQEFNDLAARDMRGRRRYQRQGMGANGGGRDKLGDPGMGSGLNPVQVQRGMDLASGQARGASRWTPEFRTRIDALRQKYGFGASTDPNIPAPPSREAIQMSRGRKNRNPRGIQPDQRKAMALPSYNQGGK